MDTVKKEWGKINSIHFYQKGADLQNTLWLLLTKSDVPAFTGSNNKIIRPAKMQVK